jgi:HAD superfamily hydrolase (TIGR01450 family)
MLPAMTALDRLRAARAFLLDMDGTVYVDERLCPGAAELIAGLRARGLPLAFLTNNSSARGEDYRARLARLGVSAARAEIHTSGDATIAHLATATALRRPYVVGTPALHEDFRAAGLEPDPADPDCLVVGFDTTLTYAKLERATALLFAGLPYFATHPDRTCITRRGLIPDVAAIIGALAAVTGRQPEILGKPDPRMALSALARCGVAVSDAVLVGDQLDTDMALAQGAGLLDVLVLSGETGAAALDAAPRRPTLVARDAGEIHAWLTGP